MKSTSRPPSRRGAAILIVLAMVTLSTVLVVSVMQSGISEKKLALGNSNLQSAERHADTALQLVLAQLRTATTPGPGTPAPWSSQPGAVTVHHMDGTVDRIFKLYSAADPVVPTAEGLARDLPVRWDLIKGQFFDLNQPFTGNGGALSFPIADPRMAGPDGAEGFAIDSFNVPNGTTPDNLRAPDERRLPMPVRWVYILEDGTTGTLNDDGIFTSPNGRATAQNPITARIAWWADDESAKINVNTAGEASPWDTPRLTTEQDKALAKNQPMRGEYHRYPGHPAGVSLSTVLFPRQRWLQPGDVLPFSEELMPQETAEGLWELAAGAATDPDLTSLGGTRQPPGLEMPQGNGVEDPWHLYTSPHELRFAQNRTQRRLFEKSEAAATRLDRSDFLLTAVSRAPETTLFGTPRVSLWPVHESVRPGEGYSSPVERASSTDTLLALCATAGNRRYYVQRATPGDGSADFQRTGLGANSQLYEWISGLLEQPFPGFARESGTRTFAEKYGAGPDGDSRNLVALMLDYIRTTNLADGAIARENQYSVVCPGNETEGYGQISPLNTAKGSTGKARWNADQTGAATGLGRIPTINGAVFVLICRAICGEDGEVRGSPSSEEVRKQLKTPGAREMEAALLFEGFVPGQGWAESRPYCSLVAATHTPGQPVNFERGMHFMRVNGKTLTPTLPAKLTKLSDALTKRNRMPEGWTASGGASAALLANTLIFSPFVVQPGPDDGGFLDFSGTPGSNESNPGFKVGIFDSPGITASTAPSSLGDLVQVVEMNFPPVPPRSLRLPTPPSDSTPFSLEDRLISVFEKGTPLLSDHDIAQAIVPAHGDSRLIAGKRIVPAQTFVAYPGYGTRALAHRLPNEPGDPASAAAAAEGHGYFPDIPQPLSSLPDFPVKPWDQETMVIRPGTMAYNARVLPMAQAFAAGRLDNGKRGPATPADTGDFDTASGRAPDGPYINRADDGELRGYKGNGVPYFDAPASDPKSIPAVSAAASSPNRLVSGPGMFGSLPTGVKANVPWQTLLFRPWLKAVTPEHPLHYGATFPQDHLLLDLFWMPVVEPYGLSTPLETAGKINLNQDLMPFRHIRRDTALHALLKSERILAVPDEEAGKIKQPTGFSNAVTRQPIDAKSTLEIWAARRKENDRPWLSASEVCTLPLIPAELANQAHDADSLADWWEKHRLTGDNLKERPYTNLHSRLTTRSNIFRVHIAAQSLQKTRSSNPAKWEEDKDQVMATWRGSALISRHVRAQDLPDYATAPNSPSVDHFYTWSITRQHRAASH